MAVARPPVARTAPPAPAIISASRAFLDLSNVIASPHNSAQGEGAHDISLRRAVENCRRALTGEAPLHAGNHSIDGCGFSHGLDPQRHARLRIVAAQDDASRRLLPADFLRMAALSIFTPDGEYNNSWDGEAVAPRCHKNGTVKQKWDGEAGAPRCHK